jgi:hypothetical protein
VLVRLQDSTGREVYRKDFAGAGGTSDSGVSSAGVPGAWKIHLTISGSGGFTLRVDRA